MSDIPAVTRRSGPTGRYLVLLRRDETPAAQEEGLRQLQNIAAATILHSSALAPDTADLPDNCALVFDHIGVALLRCSPSAGQDLSQRAVETGAAILAIEPERTLYASPDARRYAGSNRAGMASTWGIAAVGAHTSRYTGAGVRIAILDTGLDLEHPDFLGRKIQARSFIEGEPPQDVNGHGTHCAGIAAGPRDPASGPRYGVAPEAELFVGKVLSDAGMGADGSVLAGIDWAIQNGCHIISMSLGSAVAPGQPWSRVFEAVAQRALAAGSLIIAAAGNESSRPEHIAPVGHPANCPSILAVAAVDQHLRVAPFSCGGLEPDGGEVNLAAPGVDIASSWPMPQQYRATSGTSMATPFVAGVAALHAQAASSAPGVQLRDRLMACIRPLEQPARDVGEGLVQAPPDVLKPGQRD